MIWICFSFKVWQVLSQEGCSRGPWCLWMFSELRFQCSCLWQWGQK